MATPPVVLGAGTHTGRRMRKHFALGTLFLLMFAGSFSAVRAQNVQYTPAMTNVTSGSSGFAGDGALASTAKLAKPADVAFDKIGNMFIADMNNNAIRRIDAVTGIITTVAGTGSATGGFTGDGGQATAATLNAPTGVAVDSLGNIYIADTNNNAVRVVKAGVISTFAGSTVGASGSTGNGGLATAALLNFPTALAIDSANNVYVADAHNSEVRKITISTGIISRYAGTGKGGVSAGDGGAASAATMNNCYGIALDAAGNMYVSDTKNFVIRFVNASTQVITTVAGVLGVEGTVGQTNGNGGPATSAKLDYVQRLTVDRNGNVILSDTNAEQLRLFNPVAGTITALAGVGTSGNAIGAALSGKLNGQLGISVDAANNVYIADAGNNVVRKVNASALSPFAATSVAAVGTVQSFYALLNQATTISSFQTGAGFADFTTGTLSGCTLGSSDAAGLICGTPVTFAPQLPGVRLAPLTLTDNGGLQYTLGLSGVGNAPLISFAPGTITTTAGTGVATYSGDGNAPGTAQLNQPASSVVDGAGTIYIADTANNAVRRIKNGTITTIAGNGNSGFLGDGGTAKSAQLSGPTALALDAADDLFIADTGNNRIRKISAQTGDISTIAGDGTANFAGDGGAATLAELMAPAGIAVDLTGNVYVADTGNNRIRLVSASTGFITTIAGNGTPALAGDGGAASAAELNHPSALALDFNGNLFIADTANAEVRKIALAAGTIAAVAGNGSAGFGGDGTVATSASLSSPSGIAIDAAGDLYIADAGNNRIRQVLSSNSFIATIAGAGSASFSGDAGAATSATLNQPGSIALDASGRLLIADTMNNRLRLVDPSLAPMSFGAVNPGTSSLPLTAVATNTGNQTLTFTNLSISNLFVSGTATGNTCTATTTLGPGQSCSLTLTFQPTTTGNYSGSISFTDNSLNQSSAVQSISLSGSSTETPTGYTVTGLASTVTAGAIQTITVAAAKDSSVVTSYAGIAHFTSSDPKAVLPADYTYTASDAGQHTFSVTFKTAGSQSVSIVDAQNANIIGAEAATVTANNAASIVVLSGNTQTTQLGGTFPTALGVQVVDAYGNGVTGSPVVFTAPSSGASGTFANNTVTTTATTDINGDALATTLTANGVPGSYAVNAATAGIAPVNFNLTNSGNPVPALTLTLSPAASSLAYGASTTLNAALAPATFNSIAATGTVTFYDSCSALGALSLGTGTVNTGVASFSDAAPTTGTQSFTASYSGDANFGSSSTTNAISLTVNTASVTLTGPPQTTTVVAGQAGKINITVAGQNSGANIVPPTGSLSYQIGSGAALTAPIATGVASIPVPSTQSGGSYFVTVTYPGDGNYQTASISVPLTVSLQSQTISFTALANHVYGDAPVTLSATATSGLPVTFKIVSGPAAVSGSTLMILGAGSITVEADQAGSATVAAAAPVQQSFTVAQATTQAVITPLPATGNQAASIALTATVTSTAGVPTGAVGFYSGATLLGSGTLNSAGVAIYNTTALAVGQDVVTAKYAGDTNFLTSTSSSTTITIIAANFAFTLPSQSFTTPSGQPVITTMTLSATGGYSGSIAFSCSNLPANTTCTVEPNPVVLTPTAPSTTAILVVQTSATRVIGGTSAELHRPTNGGNFPLAASLLGLPSLLFGLVLSKRRRSFKPTWALLVLLLAGLGAIAGCGGSTTANNAIPPTPKGTTTFTVTGTDGTITRSATYTLVVQ